MGPAQAGKRLTATLSVTEQKCLLTTEETPVPSHCDVTEKGWHPQCLDVQLSCGLHPQEATSLSFHVWSEARDWSVLPVQQCMLLATCICTAGIQHTPILTGSAMLQRGILSGLRRGLSSSQAAAFSTSGVSQSLFSDVPIAPKASNTRLGPVCAEAASEKRISRSGEVYISRDLVLDHRIPCDV